jgi:peptide/nickel transport system ATP-binding protein
MMRPPAMVPGTPLIELRGVGKDFVAASKLGTRISRLFAAPPRPSAMHAVQDVDLALAPGEIVALVGAPGSGRSTLARIVAGVLAPDRGERRWKGELLVARTRRRARALALPMQLVLQESLASIDARLPVLDIVTRAPLAQGLIGAHQRIEYAGLMLNRVGVDPTSMRRYPREFSAAQRVRIDIARAIAQKCELLVCDEFDAGLEAAEQVRLLKLVAELRRTLNVACLLVGRDTPPVHPIADRTLVMQRGRVLQAAIGEDVAAGTGDTSA